LKGLEAGVKQHGRSGGGLGLQAMQGLQAWRVVGTSALDIPKI